MYKVYKEAFNMGATQEVPKEAQSLHLISESSDSMEPPDLSFFKISDSDATNNSNSDVISASPGDVTDEDSHDVRNEDPEELQVEDGLKLIWENEQMELKQKLVCEDVCDWARLRITPNNADEHPDIRPLQYLGGVDISFVKDDNINACAALVVIELPTLEVVYEDCTHIELTAPYIPGFLAFREVNFLVDKVKRLQETSPELMPQVILCDGNGILHPRGFFAAIALGNLCQASSSQNNFFSAIIEFGVACHLGVLLDIPALGAAKKLYQVFGLEKNEEHKQKIEQLTESDDRFPLVGDSGRILGMALRSNAKTKNPIYVSPGHKLTVDTAVWVVQQCCKYRVPEPIRQADVQSREFLRQNFKPPGVSTAAECSAASCDDSRPSPQPEDVTVCENDSMST